ncbi:RDD family protein [Oculatella sp. LEGE 06141]|uniref:RDD family protein n=1 Tax=Oculatella sp. LEGE 06141 TaxID=1828648 RepID=UPI00187E1A0E|nr:RDD family protein [Oculatella sp. LEGE 06141]MBE9181036.1 RDD family protein [Oculatella sp. LEGE 06141]
MRDRYLPARYPKVPLGRRSAAFAIDFVAVALLSSVVALNPLAQSILFLGGWIGMRVIAVSKNRGQSLGWWALDIRVVDIRSGSTPDLQTLVRREAIAGLGAMFALLGVVNLSPAAAWSILLFLPLGADCGFALVDEADRQAFHDRFADTIVVQTRRGYSLDIKLRRLLAQVKGRVK